MQTRRGMVASTVLNGQSILLLVLLSISILQSTLLVSGLEETLCGSDAYCLSGSCDNDTCTCSTDYPDCRIPSTANCSDITDYCLNGGSCQVDNTAITCLCDTVNSGVRCEVTLCDVTLNCSPNDGVTCLNNTLTNEITCDCGNCYTGIDCTQRIDLCSGIENGGCMNGECETNCDVNNSPESSCKCPPEYKGLKCQFDFEECAEDPQPCLNNGTCNEQIGSYSCDCSQGWTGQHCEQDINECEETGYCISENTHSCDNSEGSYSCRCKDGFDGVNCDIASCTVTHDLCLGHGNCSTNGTHWSCDCLQFYSGDRCEIRGPCLDEPCVHGTCSQSLDSERNLLHTCTCNRGYTNSTNCAEDVDECSLYSPCQNNGACTNTDGGYNCTCTQYWQSDNCTVDVEECLEEGICGTGVCVELEGSFNCNCTDTGYTGDACQTDINECMASSTLTQQTACHNGGMCNNLIGSYNCTCSPDWLGDRCEIRNYCYDGCVLEHTINNSSCTNTENSAICSCASPWLGSDCSVMDKCVDHVCENSGTCELKLPEGIAGNNDTGIPYCICESRFTGDKCETPFDNGGEGDPGSSIPIIASVSVVGGVLLIVIIALIICFVFAKKKRAVSGRYSPSRNETLGFNVEMSSALKPPPEERLI